MSTASDCQQEDQSSHAPAGSLRASVGALTTQATQAAVAAIRALAAGG